MILDIMSRATREPPFVPDELDLMILEYMAKDASVQFKQLAESLNADQRTIAKRVGKMKQSGVLQNKIQINWSRIGLGIAAYVGAETSLGEKDLGKLHEFIRKEPRVIEAYSTIGSQEYFIKVIESDLQRLREEVLMQLEPITSKLTSSIISSQVKQEDDVSLLRFLRQRWFAHKKSKNRT
ncbi:Putative transcriptional regulator, AsnC family [Nitrosotalea devaniterrae]|uniref:Transcriptional regulator, AsnC family n=1 Tax=Nitrosotalea devaniterrae TaxID=1078905 RepID=A0A128A4H9_9ARCH|nr:Putative transcriptional regulator, AsnC family [Candidatus Nitrosotalea devanaterra]